MDKASINTWQLFVERLHSRFRPIQASMIARQRLDKLRQRPGQQVNVYVNLFQTILTPITDMGEADQVHHFVNGLLGNIASKVWERHPTTLKLAIDYAVSVEAMGNYGRAAMSSGSVGSYHSSNPRQLGNASQSYSQASTSVPMDINHVRNDYSDVNDSESELVDLAAVNFKSASSPSSAVDVMQAMMAKMESMENRINSMHQSSNQVNRNKSNNVRVAGLTPTDISDLRAQGKCFRCKQVGHMKNQCPQKSNTNQRLNY